MDLRIERVLHDHSHGSPDEVERPLRRRELDQLHAPHLDPVIFSCLREHLDDLRRDVVEITEVGEAPLFFIGQREFAGEGRPGLLGTLDQLPRVGRLPRAKQHERLQTIANLLIDAVEQLGHSPLVVELSPRRLGAKKMPDRNGRHRCTGLDGNHGVELRLGTVVLAGEDEQFGEQPACLEVFRLRLHLSGRRLDRLVQIPRCQEFPCRSHRVPSFVDQERLSALRTKVTSLSVASSRSS